MTKTKIKDLKFGDIFKFAPDASSYFYILIDLSKYSQYPFYCASLKTGQVLELAKTKHELNTIVYLIKVDFVWSLK